MTQQPIDQNPLLRQEEAEQAPGAGQQEEQETAQPVQAFFPNKLAAYNPASAITQQGRAHANQLQSDMYSDYRNAAPNMANGLNAAWGQFAQQSSAAQRSQRENATKLAIAKLIAGALNG